MLHINELESGLITALYDGDILKEAVSSNEYKTELGSYNVEVKYIEPDWDFDDCCEYDDCDEYDVSTPTSSARINAFYDKITIDNLEGVFVDIFPIQNCLKTVVGYKGDFYRGFEVVFKRKDDDCEELKSFELSSKSILTNKLDVKQVNIILGRGYSHLNYYEFEYFDNTRKRIYIPSMYKIGNPLGFTLENFKVKGKIDMNIPCQISFTDYRSGKFLEVRVNNIMFYVEKNLKFSVNNKVANFEIEVR